MSEIKEENGKQIVYPSKDFWTKIYLGDDNWKVRIDKEYWTPSSGYFGDLPNYFEARKNRKFCDYNFFQVGALTEHIWWNRPLENKENLYDKAEDGIMRANLPLACRDNPEKTYKALFNVLLPQDAVLTLSNINFTDKWTEEDKLELRSNTHRAIKDLVASLGYGDRIESKGNDLFFDGKKFSGIETTYEEDKGYKENIVVTCYYKKYKEVFDRLIDNGVKREITGICDEIPELTPEMIISAIRDQHVDFFKRLLRKQE